MNNPLENNAANQTDMEQEFLASIPVLRADLKFSEHDQKSLKIEDPVRGKFFNIGKREHKFLQALDGQTNVGNAIELTNAVLGEQVISPAAAKAIVEWISTNNLLLNNSPANAERLSQSANRLGAQKRMGWMNPVSAKISLGNPTPLLNKILPATSWVFSSAAFFVWTIIIIWATQSVFDKWDAFSAASTGVLSNGRWIWLLVSWVVLKLIHEAAHGIACIRYGGTVREAGVLFLLFTPMAYVDVTSSWRFPKRRQRMIVAAAGMYAELFVAAVAALIWTRLETGIGADICYNLIVMAGITTILFNANPLMRFDGYYLLSDTIGIANLYTKSQAWLLGWFRNLLFGFPKTDCGESGWKKVVVKVYGVAAFTWKTTLTASLLIASSCLFDGFGLILAMVGGFFWVAMPLHSQYRQLKMQLSRHEPNWRRFSIVATAFSVAVGAAIFFLAAPRMTTSPAQVQLRDELILRSPSDGFVEEILVADGANVSRGDAILVLRNASVLVQVEGLRAAIEQAKVQSRIRQRDNELDKYQEQLLKLVGLREQLAEVESQQNELVVRAPKDGRIFRRDLQNIQGSYLKRGDMIASIGEPGETEILVSIDQRRVDSLAEISESPVRVIIPGTGMLIGRVTSITPRASDVPTSEQWCAPNGGPLAVRMKDPSEDDSKTGFRLTEPRFNATISLTNTDAARLKPGQRGAAFLHTHRQSLATWIYLSTKRWIKKKVELSTQAL